MVSGAAGVVDIEMAIKTRFNPEKYKICWLLPPQSLCEKTGLQCIHIWISEKCTPSLLHMLKIRKYLKKLNKGWDGSKERKSIWKSLGCLADVE